MDNRYPKSNDDIRQQLAEITRKVMIAKLVDDIPLKSPLFSLIPTPPPLTRWGYMRYRVKRFVWRARDAWAVLCGRKEIE